METLKLWDSVPGKCAEEPVLEYYPAADKKTTATAVILPGGAYCFRASDHEGKSYAEYLNSLGMDAFVCEYRIAPEHHFPLPLLDTRRSIRYIRANAEKFGVDPQRIAVMGSSAGGHLAALTSTYTKEIDFEGVDDIDKISPMPNATILCYPVVHMPDDTNVSHSGSYDNLLGPGVTNYADYSPDLLVNDNTPTAFIWHTSEDGGVNVINSYLYAAALRRHGIHHELHVFPDGPHGLGLAPDAPHVAQWAVLLKNWLGYIGWLA
jgi:acetyl esterase/lipase